MTFCETSIITALYCTIKRHPQGIERGPLRNKQEQYTSRGFYHQTTYSIKSLVNFYNFLVCLDKFQAKKFPHQASTLPTIEACFNCFGTRSPHTKKDKKDNKTTRENSKVAKMFSTPPGRERWESQRWRKCLKESSHTTPALWVNNSVLIVTIWNNLKRYTRGYVRTDVTDTQSINQG